MYRVRNNKDSNTSLVVNNDIIFESTSLENIHRVIDSMYSRYKYKITFNMNHCSFTIEIPEKHRTMVVYFIPEYIINKMSISGIRAVYSMGLLSRDPLYLYTQPAFKNIQNYMLDFIQYINSIDNNIYDISQIVNHKHVKISLEKDKIYSGNIAILIYFDYFVSLFNKKSVSKHSIDLPIEFPLTCIDVEYDEDYKFSGIKDVLPSFFVSNNKYTNVITYIPDFIFDVVEVFELMINDVAVKVVHPSFLISEMIIFYNLRNEPNHFQFMLLHSFIKIFRNHEFTNSLNIIPRIGVERFQKQKNYEYIQPHEVYNNMFDNNFNKIKSESEITWNELTNVANSV